MAPGPDDSGPELPPVGATLRKDSVRRIPWHVRGYVDGRVVVRAWSYRWKTWEYRVLDWSIVSPFWETR